MKSNDTFYKRKKIITFSAIFLSTAIIAAFLLAYAWHKEDDIHIKNEITPAENAPKNNAASTTLSFLKAKLYTLQQSDKEYCSILLTSNDTIQLENINKRIREQENILRLSIDSIFLQATTQPSEETDPLVKEIVVGYRSIFENRNTIASLRSASLAGTRDMKPGEMALMNTENEMREKEIRIGDLERQLKTALENKVGSRENPEISYKKVTALQDDNSNKASEILSLTSTNSRLELENEKLMKQKNEFVKNSAVTETILKQKITGLQQDVQASNADVRLAQVDCNLNRVDAGKIIYSSKQRKELLAEASGILRSLSESEDAGTRKKAQDKINRLNKITASSRD